MSDDVRLERYIGSWAADDPDANLKAEAAGTDAARLEAYDALRQMLAWLRSPLEHDGHEGDEGHDEGGA